MADLIIIIVLGLILNPDKSPKPELLERTNQAVKEANKLPGSKLLLTGGDPAKVNFTEAAAMAKDVTKKGIDRQRILLEEKALDTIQNAYYSLQKMDDLYSLSQDNKTAEIHLLTSVHHMPRASWIFRVMSEAMQIKVRWRLVSVPNKDFKTKALIEKGYLEDMPRQIKALMDEKGIAHGEIEDLTIPRQELAKMLANRAFHKAQFSMSTRWR